VISDARLIGLFSGSNRQYVLTLSDGERVYFRARSMRDARHVAREFVSRLSGRTLIGVEHV
jgi:hypothetical protein